MKVLNFGSVNLDDVFSVEHIVAPGETVSSSRRDLFPGGKGLNQSIALARAGAEVYHAGAIGPNGELLRQAMSSAGVRLDFLRSVDTPTGKAIIQVDQHGQNSIVLYPGANREQTEAAVEQTLAYFQAGDMLLLQNEINLVDVLIRKAHEKGLMIALNPSPFDEAILCCDLQSVDLFLLNEVEGTQLTGETEESRILDVLGRLFPRARIVLTLGEKGAKYHDSHHEYVQAAFPVKAVDTTAAGDTFTGYFLASLSRSLPVPEALRCAAQASAIAVERKGASCSIPSWEEVQAALREA